jgi:hypothetical protein
MEGSGLTANLPAGVRVLAWQGLLGSGRVTLYLAAAARQSDAQQTAGAAWLLALAPIVLLTWPLNRHSDMGAGDRLKLMNSPPNGAVHTRQHGIHQRYTHLPRRVHPDWPRASATPPQFLFWFLCLL